MGPQAEGRKLRYGVSAIWALHSQSVVLWERGSSGQCRLPRCTGRAGAAERAWSMLDPATLRGKC